MKIITILVLLITATACSSEKQQKKENITIDSSQHNSIMITPNSENHEKTVEKIETQKVTDTPLFNDFIRELKQENFALTKSYITNDKSYMFCEKNIVYRFQGGNIQSYHFARVESKPKGYFPDFTLFILQFKDSTEARNSYKKISSALKSKGRFCNGKAPQEVVLHKNQVFHLQTRAVMFRDYISTFALWLRSCK